MKNRLVRTEMWFYYTDAKNTMKRTGEIRGGFKENGNKNDASAEKQKETVEVSRI